MKLRARTITEAKTASFREFLDEASQGSDLWRLAKWSKGVGNTLPQVPTLHTDQGLAEDYASKVAAFQKQFFPVVEADLSDIATQITRTPFHIEQAVTTEEVAAILQSCSPRSAPGDDDIPFKFLQALGTPIVQAITHLAEASLRLEHLPPFLKTARTVVLKKPGKESYEVPGAWRPITLLKTIGKIVEKIVAGRIRHAAEAGNLIPPSQMGARSGRSTDTALELLTSMVKTIWGEGRGQVASLLSLDISGAFPTTVHRRLLAVIRQLGFPVWIQNWIGSFLTDRRTTLLFNGAESEPFHTEAGLPQRSPLSPILYLLYNKELIRETNQPSRGVHSIGFMDDLNILVYSSSTETNCARLAKVHEKCLKWAQRFGVAFAPKKYELIHFTTARNKHNLQASIELGGVTKEPSKSVRVLGVWLDPKLKWSAHAKVAHGKGKTAIAALSRISASTWGASFSRSRLLYNSAVQPVIAYGASTWLDLDKSGTALQKAMQVQSSGLRVVAGAFRATPITELETETFTPPLDIYCKEQVAAHIRRTFSSPVGSFIREQCRTISSKLRRRRRVQARSPPPIVPAIQKRLDWAAQRESCFGTGKAAVLYEWRARWQADQEKCRNWLSQAAKEGPEALRLNLHSNLRKAESAVLIQARTGRISLSHFLSKARVPGFPSPLCTCGEGTETAEHVLAHCKNLGSQRPWRNGTKLIQLVSQPECSATTARWLIKSGRLAQFSLAKKLLYSDQEA